MSHKATLNATMLPFGQGFFHPVATTGAISRRELRGNFPDLPPSTFSLDGQYRNEGSPRSISNRLRKMMVLDQSLNVQILNGDLIEFSDNLQTQFVKEITALVGNSQMFSRKNLSSFSPIRAAAFLFTHFALGDFQRPLSASQVVPTFYHLARRKRSEILDTNIKPNAIACLGNPRRLVFYNGKDSKPSVRLPLDGAGLRLALNLTRETQANMAYSRQPQPIAREIETVPSKGKAIVATCAPEPGEALFPAKERLVCAVNPTQHLLAYVRINRPDIWALRPNALQLQVLIKPRDRFLASLVGIPALLQRGVVKLTAHAKGLLKLLDHCLGRSPDFEFICLQVKGL